MPHTIGDAQANVLPEAKKRYLVINNAGKEVKLYGAWKLKGTPQVQREPKKLIKEVRRM